jgi:TonB family protein
MLPVIARQVFAEGRERFTAKQPEEAVTRFSLVLKLLADPAFADASARQDLETLAKGFIDLANAAPVAKAEPEAIPPPAPEPAPEPAVPPKVTQPIALEQTVPPMPTDVAARAVGDLVLLVQIDATGRVSSTTVRDSAHPRYDRIVTQAARDWRYTPATRDGVPIPSEQVITIQLKR